MNVNELQNEFWFVIQHMSVRQWVISVVLFNKVFFFFQDLPGFLKAQRTNLNNLLWKIIAKINFYRLLF